LISCRPCQGLDGFDNLSHGFTVGYYLSRLRRLAFKSFSRRAKARSKASWFFQLEKSGM
jgi:hypothetical protein